MKDYLKKTLSVAIIPLMLLGATACSKKEEESKVEDETPVVEHTFDSKEAFKEDDGSDLAVLVGSDFDIGDYFTLEGYSYSYDGKVDTKTVGDYEITVKALDSYGMTGTLTKTVKVVSELDAQADLDALDKITSYSDSGSTAKTYTSNNKKYTYSTETDDSGKTTVVVKSGTTETKANDGLADGENGSVTDTSSNTGSVSRSDIVVEVKDYLNGTSNMTQEEMEEMEKRHNSNRDTSSDKTTSTDEYETAEDGSTINVTKSKALAKANEAKIAVLKEEDAKALAEENAVATSGVVLQTRTVGVEKKNIKDLATSDFDESVLDTSNAVVKKAYEYVGKEMDSFSFDYCVSNAMATVLGNGKSMKQVEASTYEIGDTIKYIDENGDYFHIAIYLGNGLALHTDWNDSKIGIGPVELSGVSEMKIWHWVNK